MRRFYGLTAPIWIFLMTLLLIVVTSGVVGGSAKNVAILPLSILILGFVLYRVWQRQEDRNDPALPPAAENPAGPVPAPARSPAPTARNAAPKRGATVTTARPAAADKTRASSDVPAKPEKHRKAGDTGADGSELLRAAMAPGEDASKEELGGHIDGILGLSKSGFWKPASTGDLELLARGLAIAALGSPPTSKYRAGLQAAGAPPPAVPDHVQEETKKALHAYCVDTLRADLQALAAQDSTLSSPEKEVLAATLTTLGSEDALAGLARCSKAALARLALFLGHA